VAIFESELTSETTNRFRYFSGTRAGIRPSQVLHLTSRNMNVLFVQCYHNLKPTSLDAVCNVTYKTRLVADWNILIENELLLDFNFSFLRVEGIFV